MDICGFLFTEPVIQNFHNPVYNIHVALLICILVNAARESFLHQSSDSASVNTVPYERYISFPEHGAPSSSSPHSSSPSSPAISSSTMVRSSPPPVSHEQIQMDDSGNDEQYILLEECFSGPTQSSTSTSLTLPSVQQNISFQSISSGGSHSPGSHAYQHLRQPVEYCNLSGECIAPHHELS